jgi:SAM-dependent methyltransferase
LPLLRQLAEVRGRRITHRAGRRAIMERSELLEFWRQPDPPGNRPTDYIEPVDRSRVLSLLLSDFPEGARILEVGCNVGRNLAYLADAGYSELEGVEINSSAVDLLRRTYPQLAGTTIHIGAAEEVLPDLPGPYDLVFTMAVLMHVHPESSVIFDELVRLSDVILAVEPAPGRHFISTRTFPHDFKQVFESRGMELVSLYLLQDPMWQPNDCGNTAAWRFERRKPLA